jgi:hypothetical protein
MSLVEAGRVKLKEVAEKIGRSYREAKRVWKKFQEEGNGGIFISFICLSSYFFYLLIRYHDSLSQFCAKGVKKLCKPSSLSCSKFHLFSPFIVKWQKNLDREMGRNGDGEIGQKRKRRYGKNKKRRDEDGEMLPVMHRSAVCLSAPGFAAQIPLPWSATGRLLHGIW